MLRLNNLRIVINITVKPIAACFPVNIIGMVVKGKQSKHLLYDKVLVLSRIISTPKKMGKEKRKKESTKGNTNCKSSYNIFFW